MEQVRVSRQPFVASRSPGALGYAYDTNVAFVIPGKVFFISAKEVVVVRSCLDSSLENVEEALRYLRQQVFIVSDSAC